MISRSKVSGIGLLALTLVLAIISGPATSAQNGADEAIPAFHAQPPNTPIPETLSPSLFANAVVQNAYALAAHVKKLLYQQPCYCHCDRSQGHGSLLDCYTGKHASECDVCIREGFYTYEQSRKGKSAAQIRAGIEKGEWHQVDLSKYQIQIPEK